MPIGIYPPTLRSSQSPFLIDTTDYRIYFTLQTVTSFEEIGHIQIRIVKQSNHGSIVDTSRYPDGAIYLPRASIGQEKNQYYVDIGRSMLNTDWEAGTLYKIQMRFGSTEMFSQLSQFASWKKDQIENQTFSEWSTVMIIKSISKPTTIIVNAEEAVQDVISSENTEATLTPLFIGQYTIPTVNKEALDKYQFTLYNNSNSVLETSGWLQHNSSNGGLDEYRFKYMLDNNGRYKVKYEVITVNGYQQASETYSFVALRTYLSGLESVSLRIEDDTPYCSENGCINIYCTSVEPFNGNYVITRSDEHTNYRVWEDLKYLTLIKQKLNDTLIFQDFTIESGIKYKYAIQWENSEGLRTSPVYDAGNNWHSVDFEYSYLYKDGVQLRFQFNQALSSFKHTTLRAKQDTLGDRYPHLVQNGNAYYAEFPISGLISFHMDSDQTFFQQESNGYYYKDELVIPRDKFIGAGEKRLAASVSVPTTLTIDTNLTDNNIFVERIFREKAEEFLNDFEYKLYKSPTEGNIIIGMLNVSLTPNTTLGRMIFNFSATAYEVLDNTIENLNEFKIINIGDFASLTMDDPVPSFGQVAGIYGINVDILALIRKQEEVSIGGGYKTSLKQVTGIYVEQYPQVDLTGKLLELNAERAALLNQGEDASQIEAEIVEIERLQRALSGPQASTTKLRVNGTRVVIPPNRVYSVNEPISSLSIESAIAPIIVNYICELAQEEDETVGVVSSIAASRIWGQVSGVFTGTHSILQQYDYDYRLSETYRIYNPVASPKAVVKDKYGNILVDATNYNVYKSINLFDVIKEETRRQVEYIYNTSFHEENGQLTDGKIYYEFSNIIELDIETDAGTTLLLGKMSDGSDAVEIKIGPTCRYILKPMESLVRYISLSKPAFCVINYKCLTNQITMAKQERRRR